MADNQEKTYYGQTGDYDVHQDESGKWVAVKTTPDVTPYYGLVGDDQSVTDKIVNAVKDTVQETASKTETVYNTVEETVSKVSESLGDYLSNYSTPWGRLFSGVSADTISKSLKALAISSQPSTQALSGLTSLLRILQGSYGGEVKTKASVYDLFQSINSQTGKVLVDALSDIPGANVQLLQSLVTGKSPSLSNILPGASALSKVSPYYAEGYTKLDQVTNGKISDAYMLALAGTGSGAATSLLTKVAPVAAKVATNPTVQRVLMTALGLTGWQQISKSIQNQDQVGTTVVVNNNNEGGNGETETKETDEDGSQGDNQSTSEQDNSEPSPDTSETTDLGEEPTYTQSQVDSLLTRLASLSTIVRNVSQTVNNITEESESGRQMFGGGSSRPLSKSSGLPTKKSKKKKTTRSESVKLSRKAIQTDLDKGA